MSSERFSRENHNFYQYASFLLNKGSDVFLRVLHTFCDLKDLTLEEFFEQYKHDLFHLGKESAKCCCGEEGGNKIIHKEQWGLLYQQVEDSCPNEHDTHPLMTCFTKWKAMPTTGKKLEIDFLADIILNLPDIVRLFVEDYLTHLSVTSFRLFLDNQKSYLVKHYEEEIDFHNRPKPKITFKRHEWKNLYLRNTEVTLDKIPLKTLVKVVKLSVPLFRHLDAVHNHRHLLYAHPSNRDKMANREYEDNLLETGNSLTEIMKQLRVPEQDLDEFTKQIDDLLNAPFSSDVEIKEISRRIDHMTRLTNEMIHLNKEAQTDRQRNIESTSKSIQCHKEDLRVPTAAAERGREILDRESVLIFTGVSGQGKTWHCLEVLSEVQKECDDIIHLDNTKLDLDTWNRLVGTSSTGVLWIDNLSTISIETQKVFFEKLIKQLDKNKGNMKVVISINSEKAKERQSENVKSEWKYFCLFQDRFNVDLDKESMNYDERCAILTGFVKMGQDTSRSNIIHKFLKINIISDSENESFAEEPYAIRQSTIEEISKTFENPNFGFPECCRQFCSNKKLFSFGKRFFEDPYERTSTVLQDMMKSSDCNEKTKFCILCVLLFHDRPCAIDRIISNSFRIKSFMSLNENEIDSKTIKTISSTFIEITHRNEIKFKHDSIRKAVARTFCKYDNSCLEHFVLKGPFDLILNQCTSSLHKESSHQSQQVLVESETFITRLLNELKMNNFRRTIILVSKIIRTNPNIGVEIEKRDVPMSKRMKAALVVNSLSPLDRINYAVEESSGSFWYIYFKDIAGQSEKVVRVIRMKDLYLCQMSIDLRNQAITGRQWSEEETGNCDSDGIIVGALQSMSNDTKILEILESDNTVNIVFDKYFKQFGKTHFIVSDNSYLPDLNNNCRNCSRSTLSIGNYDISNLDSAVLITNEILFYQFTALKFMHIIQRHDLSLISLCEIHLSELYIFDSKLKNELSFHMSIEWINQTRIDVIQMLIDENKPTTETIRDLFLMSCRRGCHLIVELLLNEENNPMNVDNLSIGKGIQIACEAGHSMVVDSVLKWRNDIVSHDILAESLAKAKENDHFQAYFFILTSQQVHSYLEGNFNTTDSLYTEIVETIRTCSCRVLETVFATYIDKKNHIGIKMIYDRRPSACESEM